MIESTNQSEQPAAPASKAGGRRPLQPRTMTLLAIAIVFGLLLWAKLILVTGHPRTALADPNEQAAAAPAPAVAASEPGRGSR